MKKVFTAFLATAMLFACTSQVTAFPIENAIYNVEEKISFEDIEYNDRVLINDSVKLCFADGLAAAENINTIKSNTTDFEIGVREVLDRYYSMEKSERGQLEAFSENIDASAATILANYEEAEQERDNSEELPFETEKVLVSFPYGTPTETIEAVVGNEAVSYKIIHDGEHNIPDDLPDCKKERLKAAENTKTDIMVSVDVSLEDTVSRAIDKFKEYECVTNVSSNTYFEADGTISNGSISVEANDTYFNETDQWNLKSIDIPNAWNKFNSVSLACPIWVAVIDSGVKMNHEDLKGVLLENSSVDITQDSIPKLKDLDDEKSVTGQYTSQHGTMVAGVLAAQGNNGKGIAGVGSIANNNNYRDKIKIMAIKCDKTLDTDRHITKEYLCDAIYYAVDNGAEVINISYSAEASAYGTEYCELKNAIDYAIDNNVIVVCAAGNDGDKVDDQGCPIVRYPAGFPGVIGVGAHLKNGNIAEYSNKSSAVDIVAPGGYKTEGGAQIWSTTIKDDQDNNNNTSYTTSHGTSYATPHVAATVAMMKSIDCTLTPTRALSILRLRSTKQVTLNGKMFYFLDTGYTIALMQ